MAMMQKTDFQHRTRRIVRVLELPGQVLLPHSVIPIPRARLQRRQHSPSLLCAQDLFLTVPLLLENGSSHSSQAHMSGAGEGIGCLMQVTSRDTAGGDQGIVLMKGIGRARYRRVDPCEFKLNGADDRECLASSVRRTDLPQRQHTATGRLSMTPVLDDLVEAECMPDDDAVGSGLMELRQQLIRLLLSRCPDLVVRDLAGLLEWELPLGHLCDLAAPALKLPLQNLRELLAEPRVESRGRAILQMATQLKPVPTVGIPRFTSN